MSLLLPDAIANNDVLATLTTIRLHDGLFELPDTTELLVPGNFELVNGTSEQSVAPLKFITSQGLRKQTSGTLAEMRKNTINTTGAVIAGTLLLVSLSRFLTRTELGNEITDIVISMTIASFSTLGLLGGLANFHDGRLTLRHLSKQLETIKRIGYGQLYLLPEVTIPDFKLVDQVEPVAP